MGILYYFLWNYQFFSYLCVINSNKMGNNLKVIFLDVDGVLNHQQWFKSAESVQKNPEFRDDRYFDPVCVGHLNEITDKTGAKIVVSSSWRIGRSVEDLQKLFHSVGITGEVIDKTPHLFFQNSTASVPRGCEILEWINNNKGILGTNLLNWKDYVIIDDDTDMLYWHRKNFFNTDGSGMGLTSNLTYQIINFLGKV